MLPSGGVQLGLHNREVNIIQAFDRFKVPNNFGFNKEIQPVFPDLNPVEINPDFFLSLEFQISFSQLDRERVFINGLQETRSQLPVDLNRRTNNLPG